MIDYKKIDLENNLIYLKINTAVYSFEVIVSVMYTLLRESYVVFDGDRTGVVEVQIKPKSQIDLNSYADKIINRLALQLVHEKNMIKNKLVVDTLVTETLKKYNETK